MQPKWVCPIHNLKMERFSTKYGGRYQCTVEGCTVAGWEGSTSTPADQKTRNARIKAHDVFDFLWKGKPRKERSKLYKELSDFMGIHIKYAHIGMFNLEQCEKVFDFVKKYETFYKI